MVEQNQPPIFLNLKKPTTMTASTPTIIDSKSYDRFSLNLAITGRYENNGTPDACINLLLTPTRIEAGEVITAPEAAVSLLRGSLSEVTDPAEQAAIAAIQTALQTYITAKGL
jgi:hypothetical protein